MGAVKLIAADRWFSMCVRERASWCCERCGTYYPEGSGRMGLHCSHYHGRGKWATRFDPDNCESLCYGCHRLMGANPHQHKQRALDQMGGELYDVINEKSLNSSIGRQAKKEKKEISAHYRAEYRRMTEMRNQVATGRIEFNGYF